MTAHLTLAQNSGKRPEEIIAELYKAGFALVPVEYKMGTEIVRVGHKKRSPEDQWSAVVEFARVRP